MGGRGIVATKPSAYGPGPYDRAVYSKVNRYRLWNTEDGFLDVEPPADGSSQWMRWMLSQQQDFAEQEDTIQGETQYVSVSTNPSDR